MSHTFPSEPWVSAYKDAVNQNEKYKEAGKPWTFGKVAMVIQADSKLGIDNDTAMVLDVAQGQCNSTEYVEAADALQVESVKSAPFIIVASYNQWKDVIQGKVDPIKAMMEGKLKLTQGHLPTMIRFVESSRQLVVSATHVPTEFAH